MNETEVLPNVPRDWRDWINEFPSIKSVALFCVIAWIITGSLIGGANLWGYLTAHEPTTGVIRVLEIWLDALNWLTAAAVFGVVGKRATEKADVVRAEGEAKAAVIAAAQPVPQPVGKPHPGTDPAIVDALATVAEKQRSEEALLTQEAEARRQKHALAPPNGLEE